MCSVVCEWFVADIRLNQDKNSLVCDIYFDLREQIYTITTSFYKNLFSLGGKNSDSGCICGKCLSHAENGMLKEQFQIELASFIL